MKMAGVHIIIIACLLACFCSCEQSTTFPEADENRVDIEDKGEMLLAAMNVEGGILEVRAHNLIWNPDLEVLSIDVFLINYSDTPIKAPLYLVFNRINPSNVDFINPDGQTNDGAPFKEFDEEFGPDGTLSPDETSEADNFVFNVYENRSFSVECGLDYSIVDLGAISGVVFRDDNQNSVHDEEEVGLGHMKVSLSYVQDDGGTYNATTWTGPMGTYSFANLTAGVYTVLLDVPSYAVATTGNPQVITLLESEDGEVEDYDEADLGVYFVPDTLTIEHDFNDGLIPYWGGNATMENVDGTLKLTACGHAQWRWEIFDYELPGRYTKGTFEFKTKFGEEGSYCGLKGHSEANIFDHNRGPLVYFKEGVVRPKEGDISIETDVLYVPGEWYRVRIEFDNALGTRGRYVLYFQELSNGSPEIIVGEYDYFASLGRLVDIAEFAFGGLTLDIVPCTSFYIDDVKLVVY